MNLALIAILGLVAYRTARLVAVDEITRPARAALYRKAAGSGSRPLAWVYALVECPHCVSVWSAFAATGVLAIDTGWPGWITFGIQALAAAGIASLAVSVDMSRSH